MHLQHLRDLDARLLQAAVRQAGHGRPLLRLHQTAQALRETARQDLERRRVALDDWHHRWQTACRTQIDHQTQRLAHYADSLRLLHPQRVLERGFALLQDETGHVLSQRTDFHAGQHIVVFRTFAEQDYAARVYRFSAHRPDKRLITDRLLVEVEHLRLAERL